MALIEIDEFPSDINLHLWMDLNHGYVGHNQMVYPLVI